VKMTRPVIHHQNWPNVIVRVMDTHFADVGEDDGRSDKDNGLLIDNIQLLRDGGSGTTNTKESGTGFGNETG